MNSTIVTIPKDSTFKLPQGRFKAVIPGVKTKPVDTVRGQQYNAAILFKVFVPGMENYECLARKVLPLDLKAGSELRRFLSGLLGTEYFRGKSNQAIDLNSELANKPCEVVLIHAKFDEDRYDFPLVDVESVHPPTPEPPTSKQKGDMVK